MNIRKKRPIFQMGDKVEIHLNEEGFDYFFSGELTSWDGFGMAIEDKENFVFIPHNRILYLSKHKTSPEIKAREEDPKKKVRQ